MQRRLDEATGEIEAAESRIAVLNEQFCAPDFYDATPADERRALEEEHARLNETLTDRMQEWETLEAKIAALPEP